MRAIAAHFLLAVNTGGRRLDTDTANHRPLIGHKFFTFGITAHHIACGAVDCVVRDPCRQADDQIVVLLILVELFQGDTHDRNPLNAVNLAARNKLLQLAPHLVIKIIRQAGAHRLPILRFPSALHF